MGQAQSKGKSSITFDKINYYDKNTDYIESQYIHLKIKYLAKGDQQYLFFKEVFSKFKLYFEQSSWKEPQIEIYQQIFFQCQGMQTWQSNFEVEVNKANKLVNWHQVMPKLVQDYVLEGYGTVLYIIGHLLAQGFLKNIVNKEYMKMIIQKALSIFNKKLSLLKGWIKLWKQRNDPEIYKNQVRQHLLPILCWQKFLNAVIKKLQIEPTESSIVAQLIVKFEIDSKVAQSLQVYNYLLKQAVESHKILKTVCTSEADGVLCSRCRRRLPPNNGQHTKIKNVFYFWFTCRINGYREIEYVRWQNESLYYCYDCVKKYATKDRKIPFNKYIDSKEDQKKYAESKGNSCYFCNKKLPPNMGQYKQINQIYFFWYNSKVNGIKQIEFVRPSDESNYYCCKCVKKRGLSKKEFNEVNASIKDFGFFGIQN